MTGFCLPRSHRSRLLAQEMEHDAQVNHPLAGEGRRAHLSRLRFYAWDGRPGVLSRDDLVLPRHRALRPSRYVSWYRKGACPLSASPY